MVRVVGVTLFGKGPGSFAGCRPMLYFGVADRTVSSNLTVPPVPPKGALAMATAAQTARATRIETRRLRRRPER
jgi:hypothetical protein